MAEHQPINKQILFDMFKYFHPNDGVRSDKNTKAMTTFSKIVDNKQIYNDILLNEIIVPFPHNTPTNKSPLNKNEEIFWYSVAAVFVDKSITCTYVF